MAPQLIESVAAFDQALKDAGQKLVVVDFFAEWCGPCKRIAPDIKVLSEENPDVVFLKVNVDDVEDLAQAKGIRAMPTFQFYKSGEIIPESEFSGADLPKLKETVAKHK